MKKQTFEDYLKDIHAKNYLGTDDDMPDNFDNWLSNDLQVDDLIDYADFYGRKMFLDGKEELLNEMKNVGNVEDEAIEKEVEREQEKEQEAVEKDLSRQEDNFGNGSYENF